MRKESHKLNNEASRRARNNQLRRAPSLRRQVHGGFNAEFEKLRDAGLDNRVDGCASPNWVGHSLGGAMASIARLHYGKGAVYTFGCPQARYFLVVKRQHPYATRHLLAVYTFSFPQARASCGRRMTVWCWWVRCRRVLRRVGSSLFGACLVCCARAVVRRALRGFAPERPTPLSGCSASAVCEAVGHTRPTRVAFGVGRFETGLGRYRRACARAPSGM